MPRKRNTFKLGITVIIMAALLVGCLWFIGGRGLFAVQRSVIVVRFSPSGAMPEISEGSFVTYFGQKVGVVLWAGIVEDVDLEDQTITDQQFLEVQAALYEHLGLREDCKIVASGPPLGGIGMLEIISRGTSPNLVETGQPIYGQVAGFAAALDRITRELDESNPEGLISLIKVQLDAQDERSLMVKLHKSLTDVNALTANLARELDREQEGALLNKIHAGVELIDRSLAEITGLLEENRPKIDSTLTSIDRASGKLDTKIVEVLARELELEEDREVTLLTKVHDAFDCLNQSLADLNVVADEAKSVVVLNKDRISELVENAVTASTHLKQGVRDLSLHPWKIIFQPSAAEKRELHIHNVAREFAEAAAHLDDSTSRLKSLLEAYHGEISSDDPELSEIRAHLMATVDKFSAAEQALWEELKIE